MYWNNDVKDPLPIVHEGLVVAKLISLLEFNEYCGYTKLLAETSHIKKYMKYWMLYNSSKFITHEHILLILGTSNKLNLQDQY